MQVSEGCPSAFFVASMGSMLNSSTAPVFGTAHIFEGRLYIQTGKVKPCSRQLLANPKAEICAFHNGVWVRIAGELVEDDRVEAKKSMLDAYPNLRGMYDENDGNTQVFYFKDAVATFSSFTAAPETVTF